jgi:hypothetical protein
MRTRILTVALAACIPAAVFAQKPSAGVKDPAPNPGSGTPTFSGAKAPSSHDLADLNPALLLIDKRKKIPLADSTVAQLKAVQKKINDRNATFFATYDSVRKWTIPISAPSSASQGFGLHGGVSDSKLAAPTTSPADEARMQSSMHDLRLMMGQYRERRNADVADALSPVPEAQKKAATDLLAQQDGDLDKLLGGRP